MLVCQQTVLFDSIGMKQKVVLVAKGTVSYVRWMLRVREALDPVFQWVDILEVYSRAVQDESAAKWVCRVANFVGSAL